jgi:hypothetical protein
MTSLNLKFKRVDDFKNGVFAARAEDPDTAESYKTLVELKEKIDALALNTYNPVYLHGDFKLAYLTVKWNNSSLANSSLKPNAIYQLTFTINKSSYDSKQYANVVIKSMKLIKLAKKINQGEVLF